MFIAVLIVKLLQLFVLFYIDGGIQILGSDL